MITDSEAHDLAIELHPELRDWTPEDFERAEREEAVNWRLHLTLDEVVLRRISDSSLPDAKVLDELRNLGDTRLEAIHRIGGVVAEHMWKLLRSDGASPPEGPAEQLRGSAPSNTEELNDRIKALVAERAKRGHSPGTRFSGRRKR